VLATLLTGCEEYATHTPSAADLTRIVEEIPAGPTRDMIQATAVARYVEAEMLRQLAAQAQATADAAAIEHQRRVAQMTAEAQAVERARASAAEATRQALDAQARQLEIHATATAQAAQAHAQATTQAAAAQATATAQVAYVTATAQTAAIQATATEEARRTTATAQSQWATATTQAYAVQTTATAESRRATATVETHYWQQTIAAQQVTATAVARQQEQEEMELQRQRLTHPLRTFGPWVLLIASVAAIGYIAWRMVTVLEIRLRALKRDERGDAPVYAAGSGRAITLFDPDRNFWAGATIVDGQTIQVYDTAPSADHQARVVAGDQAVDLVTRGSLKGQRPFTRRQRTRVARRLSSAVPQQQQGTLGLRGVRVLRSVGQATQAGVIPPALAGSIEADWVEGEWEEA
jgi:chemotaxis protein histidine kinase CheA